MASTAISSTINSLLWFSFSSSGTHMASDTLKQGASYMSHFTTPYSICLLLSHCPVPGTKKLLSPLSLKRLYSSLQLDFTPYFRFWQTILILLYTDLYFCEQLGLSVWYTCEGRVNRNVCICVCVPRQAWRIQGRLSCSALSLSTLFL